MMQATDQQVFLDDNEFIVSKTDAKGKIIYANRVFMRIAGYPEHELLGKHHNVIRHPDMPRGAFYLLWKTLQQDKEFFAFVKNLCLDGRYYWVFANITPDYDLNQQLIGYHSVRRKPSDEGISAIIPIYQEMMSIEAKSTTTNAPKASAEFLLEKFDKLGVTYPDFMLNLS
jgi:aerotaxis receptor